MASKTNGLAALPPNLLRPTTPPKLADSAEDLADADSAEPTADEGQGRAGEARPTKGKRTRRAVVSTETKGRKLQLPDDIHDRLWLLARQKRTTVSAVAVEILDRGLPRWQVIREG